MTITTRFAPSPTGRLHVGNIRTALHNWLLAKQAGGKFLLRIDDTDAERSREEYVEAIRVDLAWLGLDPDGEERQSTRFDRYEAAFKQLVGEGRIYRCYETQQELELRRKVLLGRGLPPIYDRAALQLSEAQHVCRIDKLDVRDGNPWVEGATHLLLRGLYAVEYTSDCRIPDRVDVKVETIVV